MYSKSSSGWKISPCSLKCGSLLGNWKARKVFALRLQMVGSADWVSADTCHTIPDPLKDPKNRTPQYEPITTLGQLGDYWGVPFFGCFRGSGMWYWVSCKFSVWHNFRRGWLALPLTRRFRKPKFKSNISAVSFFN